MANARYGGFNHAGISTKYQAALTATYQVFPLTADNTNLPRTSAIPTFAQLKHLSVEMDTIAAGASSVTFYLSRDAAGDIPITGTLTAGVVFGLTTATKGSAIACIDLDYHYLQLASETVGTVYAVIKTNAGTCNGNLLLHWRA